MSAVDRLQIPHKCLKVARLDESLPLGIHAPQKEGDVGWDLEAMETVVVPPMRAVDIKVNARIDIPRGLWAECRARSSLARRGLQVDAGTIDQGYRGPLYVLLRNMTLPALVTNYTEPSTGHIFPKWMNGPMDEGAITIEAGERIGQLVFYSMAYVWADEVPESDFNFDTDRGQNGFGSTGR
jgi:dUTP pyrophosphatase